MQIFTKTGHFVKKIAIRYIDIVAGLAITQQGNFLALSLSLFLLLFERGLRQTDIVKIYGSPICLKKKNRITVNQNENKKMYMHKMYAVIILKLGMAFHLAIDQ